MLRKLTLALATAATLGAMALAPTAAFAKPFGGGGGWGGGWGFHHHHHGFGPGFVGLVGGGDDGCFVTRPVLTPFGYRLRTINVCGY
jgi:hypothetical protein